MKRIIGVLSVCCLIIACSSNDENTNSNQDNFDRKGLLEHMADHIILPALTDLEGKLETLKTSATNFTATPNMSTLAAARNSWLAAYKTWQYVEMFNIGAAETNLYYFQSNIYPTNITDIENNIMSGTVDLSTPGNNDAVGFPAIEYMIYGTGNTDAAIIDFYSTHPNASANANYLNALTTRLHDMTVVVLNDWQNGYRDQFVNSTDNTATSALNKIVNDFIFYYEKGLRANKVGIPAGVFSSSALPDRVEGLYSASFSKDLLLEAMTAVSNFYNGVGYDGTNANGLSLADYVNDRAGNSELSDEINSQLALATTKITNELGDNLKFQVENDNTKMLESYNELQRVVVLIKTDMLQILAINVDYIDADGD